MFKILVFEFKIISVEYFMDKLEEWEAWDIMENLKFIDRNEWMLTRLLMYTIALVNSKKKLNPEDIIKFPFDEKYIEEEQDKSISTKDVQRLRKLALQFKSKLNN